MLKVLHLLSSDRFSGAENVVCQIITAFDGDSEVEHLYVSPEGPIRETLKEKNIRYVPVKYLNGIDLKRIVRIEQPDIIHAHDMLASLFATFCVRNIPIVSHIHNNNFGFKGVGPFVTSLAYCIAARRAKHIFWVSEAAYNGFRYKKICSSKSSVLYNVINIEELNNSIKIDPEKYQYDLIFLGRLTYAKNPQRVLEVTKILKNQKDDIKVAMVGAGRWVLNTWQDAGLTNDDFDCVQWPVKEKDGSVYGGSAWCIGSTTEHQDLAIELLKEMVSDETLTAVAAGGQQVPPTEALATSTDIMGTCPDNIMGIWKAVTIADPIAAPSYFGDLEQTFLRELEEVFSGAKEPQAAMDEAQAQIESAIQ